MASSTTRGDRMDKRKKVSSKSALIDQQLRECSVSLEDLEGMSLMDKENLLNLLKTSEKEHDQRENVRSLYEAQEAAINQSEVTETTGLPSEVTETTGLPSEVTETTGLPSEVTETTGLPSEEIDAASDQQDTVLPSWSNRILGDERSEANAKHLSSTSLNSTSEKNILSKEEDSDSVESNLNLGSVLRKKNPRRKKIDKLKTLSGNTVKDSVKGTRFKKTRTRANEISEFINVSSGTEDVDIVVKRETSPSELVAKTSQRSRKLCVMLNESKHVADKFVSLSSGTSAQEDQRKPQMVENDKNSSESEDPVNTEGTFSTTRIRPKKRKRNPKERKVRSKRELTESDTRAKHKSGRKRAAKKHHSNSVSGDMEQEEQVLDDITDIKEDDMNSVDSENPVFKCAVSKTEKQKEEIVLNLEGAGTGPRETSTRGHLHQADLSTMVSPVFGIGHSKRGRKRKDSKESNKITTYLMRSSIANPLESPQFVDDVAEGESNLMEDVDSNSETKPSDNVDLQHNASTEVALNDSPSPGELSPVVLDDNGAEEDSGGEEIEKSESDKDDYDQRNKRFDNSNKRTTPEVGIERTHDEATGKDNTELDGYNKELDGYENNLKSSMGEHDGSEDDSIDNQSVGEAMDAAADSDATSCEEVCLIDDQTPDIMTATPTTARRSQLEMVRTQSLSPDEESHDINKEVNDEVNPNIVQEAANPKNDISTDIFEFTENSKIESSFKLDVPSTGEESLGLRLSCDDTMEEVDDDETQPCRADQSDDDIVTATQTSRDHYSKASLGSRSSTRKRKHLDDSDEASAGKRSQRVIHESCSMETPSTTSKRLVNKKWINRKLFQHEPYFAPDGVCPMTYSKTILDLINRYHSSLYKAQSQVIKRVCWSTPVVVGRHQLNTIDLKVRGKAPLPMLTSLDSESEDVESPPCKKSSSRKTSKTTKTCEPDWTNDNKRRVTRRNRQEGSSVDNMYSNVRKTRQSRKSDEDDFDMCDFNVMTYSRKPKQSKHHTKDQLSDTKSPKPGRNQMPSNRQTKRSKNTDSTDFTDINKSGFMETEKSNTTDKNSVSGLVTDELSFVDNDTSLDFVPDTQVADSSSYVPETQTQYTEETDNILSSPICVKRRSRSMSKASPGILDVSAVEETLLDDEEPGDNKTDSKFEITADQSPVFSKGRTGHSSQKLSMDKNDSENVPLNTANSYSARKKIKISKSSATGGIIEGWLNRDLQRTAFTDAHLEIPSSSSEYDDYFTALEKKLSLKPTENACHSKHEDVLVGHVTPDAKNTDRSPYPGISANKSTLSSIKSGKRKNTRLVMKRTKSEDAEQKSDIVNDEVPLDAGSSESSADTSLCDRKRNYVCSDKERERKSTRKKSVNRDGHTSGKTLDRVLYNKDGKEEERQLSPMSTTYSQHETHDTYHEMDVENSTIPIKQDGVDSSVHNKNRPSYFSINKSDQNAAASLDNNQTLDVAPEKSSQCHVTSVNNGNPECVLDSADCDDDILRDQCRSTRSSSTPDVRSAHGLARTSRRDSMDETLSGLHRNKKRRRIQEQTTHSNTRDGEVPVDNKPTVQEENVECPLCLQDFPKSRVEDHAATCQGQIAFTEDDDEVCSSPVLQSEPIDDPGHPRIPGKQYGRTSKVQLGERFDNILSPGVQRDILESSQEIWRPGTESRRKSLLRRKRMAALSDSESEQDLIIQEETSRKRTKMRRKSQQDVPLRQKCRTVISDASSTSEDVSDYVKEPRFGKKRISPTINPVLNMSSEGGASSRNRRQCRKRSNDENPAMKREDLEQSTDDERIVQPVASKKPTERRKRIQVDLDDTPAQTSQDAGTEALQTCPMCSLDVALIEFEDHVIKCVDNNERQLEESKPQLTRASRQHQQPSSSSSEDEFTDHVPLHPKKRQAHYAKAKDGVPANDKQRQAGSTAQTRSACNSDNSNASSIIISDGDSSSVDKENLDEQASRVRPNTALTQTQYSPIRSFRRISEQKDGLIDYKNQFKRVSLEDVRRKKQARSLRKSRKTKTAKRKTIKRKAKSAKNKV